MSKQVTQVARWGLNPGCLALLAAVPPGWRQLRSTQGAAARLPGPPTNKLRPTDRPGDRNETPVPGALQGPWPLLRETEPDQILPGSFLEMECMEPACLKVEFLKESDSSVIIITRVAHCPLQAGKLILNIVGR